MADEIYLLSRSYPHDPSISISTSDTEVGSNTVEKSADELRLTYFECSDDPARIDIDLGTARAIDRVYIATNSGSLALYYGSSSPASNLASLTQIVNETVDGVKHYFASFTQQTARYWRLSFSPFSGNAIVYEFALCEHQLTLDDDNRPSRIHRTTHDPHSAQFMTADGSLVRYAGPTESGKREVKLDFRRTPAANRDNLHTLWQQRAGLCLYVEPDDYPELFLHGYFSGDRFPLVYDDSLTLVGYTGSLTFQER